MGAALVERFELAEVWALDFLIYNALCGGVSESLPVATRGMLPVPAILELELRVAADSGL